MLVKDDLVCVLTDFGLAGVLDSQQSRVSSGYKGTLFWMAPELILEPNLKNSDARPRDIYSLGCTIYEIYTGVSPSAVMRSVLRGDQPVLPPDGSWTDDELELWGYVGLCLQIRPADRPTIKLVKDALRAIRRWDTSQWERNGTGSANSVDRMQTSRGVSHFHLDIFYCMVGYLLLIASSYSASSDY